MLRASILIVFGSIFPKRFQAIILAEYTDIVNGSNDHREELFNNEIFVSSTLASILKTESTAF